MSTTFERILAAYCVVVVVTLCWAWHDLRTTPHFFSPSTSYQCAFTHVHHVLVERCP